MTTTGSDNARTKKAGPPKAAVVSKNQLLSTMKMVLQCLAAFGVVVEEEGSFKPLPPEILRSAKFNSESPNLVGYTSSAP